MLLSAQGISKSFGPIVAVAGIDLSVAAGEVVCVIGPSGCGKSTLLRCINFLEEPDTGFVYLDGEPIGFRNVGGRRLRDREARIYRMRSKIGMVFQNFNLWPHLSALENVVKPQTCVAGRPRKEAEWRGRDLLAQVGVADKADAFPTELSGGQQQRVAIARALALDPPLLLFDEPTSALDPESVAEVLTVMQALARSRTAMIVVTHELRFTTEVADRILFMDAGRVVEEGSPEILHQPGTERLRQFMSVIRRG